MKEEKNQKTVLVTGGATGLGNEIAVKLQNADFQVATVDVNKGNQNFPAFQCDLTFSLNVDQLFEWTLKTIGLPDVLILNAGVGIQEKLSEGDPEKWQRVFDVNSPALIEEIGRYKKKYKFKLFFHDTHHRAVSAPEEMKKYNFSNYDGALVFGKVLKDIYDQKNWFKNVWIWHEAADLDLFKANRDEEKTGDLVWIGRSLSGTYIKRNGRNWN